MADSPEQKRRKVKNNKTQCLVGNFLKWCSDVGLILNDKVTVREKGSCHRFGMIALDDLDEGESVFKIPRDILLQPNTSSISETIVEFAKNLPEIDTRNKWLPLLLTLLYEYTNPKSKWRPYLDLVPSETVLNQPIFWNEHEREYLTLIGLKDGVDDDETNIERGYIYFVSPFMHKHKEYFDAKIHTLGLYKRLAGFVMAYSFTDSDNVDARPAMVPMADILNHISDNNAHLEFGEQFLSMVTTQRVHKGDEVFNTYGNLDNCNLLRSYGFIEESPNTFDEVEIPLTVFQDVLEIPDKEWESKISQLKEQYTTGHINTDEGILFSIKAGCSWTEPALYTFFQIIHDRSFAENDPDLENNTNTENNENVEIESAQMMDNNGQNTASNSMDKIQNKHRGVTVDNSGSGCEVDSEDGDSEGDSDTTGDTDDSGSALGDYWGIDGSESNGSSCESGETCLDWFDLQELPREWKETLKRAAIVCSEKITKLSEELSSKLNKSHETTRTAMVKNISQGHLRILIKVQELVDLEI